MTQHPTVRVLRPGNTAKAAPFAVVVVANPALESPVDSGNFIPDPILLRQPDFDACASYVVACLFGDLPGQGERLLGHPDVRDEVRVVSLFTPGLEPEAGNALVAEDDPNESTQLLARRDDIRPFLARYGLDADVAIAVSASATHDWATAYETTDDEGAGGVTVDLDGATVLHAHHALVPGAVALHVGERSLTPLHEFQHALGSYQNGQVLDLYHSRGRGVNKKQGRPIPAVFASYEGAGHGSDPTRDGLGYGLWRSYHCALHSPTLPSVMDNYFQAPDPPGALACENDTLTRRFLLDRLRAKINR